MQRRVFLINSAGASLGVLSIDENDTIVHFGGGYFGRCSKGGTIFRGEPMPIYRQPETILTTHKLDIDLVAERAKGKLAHGSLGEDGDQSGTHAGSRHKDNRRALSDPEDDYADRAGR